MKKQVPEMQIKIKKGLEIPLTGPPDQTVETGKSVRSVAILGPDYLGLKARMLVEPGDRVRLGQALFTDKRDPDVMYTAPGSGTVTAINRGARRALQSVVIELDESGAEESDYIDLAGCDPAALPIEKVHSVLLGSGLWTAFRTRPYDKVPQSDSAPRSIFVTAIDTRPLAGNPEIVVAANQAAFSIGVRIVSRLTDGVVYLCTDSEWSVSLEKSEQVRHARFSGPHPAGLPGTHIHHIDPVGTDRTVWHIGYQDVIAVGKLFSEGRISVERTVALGGEGFERPRMVTTRLGANIEELSAGELAQPAAASAALRLISGSVLNGRNAAGPEAYLGRYDLQVSAIPDSGNRRFLGWLGLFDGEYSFASRLARRHSHDRLQDFTTAQFGRPTALVAIDAFDRVLPMDILAVPLLRSLLIRDSDQAQALGCLELAAEDLALCSFVCPGKNDYGTALNINLDQIEREG